MMNYPSAAQMWQWTLGLPEQLAYRAAGLNELEAPAAPVRRILVAGMGGSGVSGRFLAALADNTAVQIIPWNWAGAPSWLTPNDAVLAISYSGNTVETLATVNDALAAGISVTGITTGGKLEKLLQERERPVFNVPDGLPPRVAFGFLLGTGLRVCSRLSGVELGQPERTTAALTQLRSNLGAAQFAPISVITKSLIERPVTVYGTCPLTAAAALRLKQQLNENAKHFAWWATLPELAHNEITAAGPGKPPRRLCLTLAEEPPPLDSVLDDGEQTIYLRGSGPDPLSAVLGLVFQGDLVSLALAEARGVEPYPIERIIAYKARLG